MTVAMFVASLLAALGGGVLIGVRFRHPLWERQAEVNHYYGEEIGAIKRAHNRDDRNVLKISDEAPSWLNDSAHERNLGGPSSNWMQP